MKIEIQLYEGEKKDVKCALSGQYFEVSPGVQYLYDNKPVSPSVAISKGFSVPDNLPVPKGVTTQHELSHFLTKTLKISNSDPVYNKLYGDWSILLPYK